MRTPTIAEREELVAKFESRTVSCDVFCKHHKITPYQIYKWRKEFSSESKLLASSELDDLFIPLEVSSSDSIRQPSNSSEPSSITSSFKIYSSDLTIEFCSGCRISELGAVIGVFGGNNAAK